MVPITEEVEDQLNLMIGNHKGNPMLEPAIRFYYYIFLLRKLRNQHHLYICTTTLEFSTKFCLTLMLNTTCITVINSCIEMVKLCKKRDIEINMMSWFSNRAERISFIEDCILLLRKTHGKEIDSVLESLQNVKEDKISYISVP